MRIGTQINMATAGENIFIAPVLLTENDVPEASLHGKKASKDEKSRSFALAAM